MPPANEYELAICPVLREHLRMLTPSRLAPSIALAFVLLALIALPCVAQHQPLLAASMPAQDAVSLFEVHGMQVKLRKSVPVGKAPGRMCLDPDGKTLYVGFATGIAAIDLNTSTVSATMTDSAIKSLFGCVVSPDGHKLYAADRDANLVFVFSLPQHTLLKTRATESTRPIASGCCSRAATRLRSRSSIPPAMR